MPKQQRHTERIYPRDLAQLHQNWLTSKQASKQAKLELSNHWNSTIYSRASIAQAFVQSSTESLQASVQIELALKLVNVVGRDGGLFFFYARKQPSSTTFLFVSC